jgi:epoxyqueuosine reductase
MNAAQRIKDCASEIGFEACGIAAADPLDAHEHYEAWLDAHMHGEMAYLASERHRERRADPTLVLPGLASVVCVALSHEPTIDETRSVRLGKIARYAGGEDYHFVMRDKLRALSTEIEHAVPGAKTLWYVDTGAILERGWAERAGIGWVGKHSGVLSREIGSWFLLGEILVDRPLAADTPIGIDHCGTCSRCMDACPTNAIVAPRKVDARLCISYLTIELRGPIPRDLRPLIGDWIFGCDICQEVCPWNRFAPPAREARLHARSLNGWSLERFLEMDDEMFAQIFAGSPIKRAKRHGLLRNVCVALGNRGDAASVAPLARALREDPHELVRGHAAWALWRIGGAEAKTALKRAVETEQDETVREELRLALPPTA